MWYKNKKEDHLVNLNNAIEFHEVEYGDSKDIDIMATINNINHRVHVERFDNKNDTKIFLDFLMMNFDTDNETYSYYDFESYKENKE